MIFDDRADAGRVLADLLSLVASEDVLVLALARGGVPVGYEVARTLRAPLDVLVARKLGAPGDPEYAIGAVAPGVRVIAADAAAMLGLSCGDVEALAEKEARELEGREKAYREGRPPLPLEGRTALIVDDGLATGATMLAAIRSARLRLPARIVAAVPVGDRDACAAVRREADELVCASTPERLIAVGNWYRDFAQTTEEEVRGLLRR
jgi:putative phosphoribosyl transferase